VIAGAPLVADHSHIVAAWEVAMAVRTGGCLCGAVRYESAGDPVFSLHCHCRDCQRSSGTAYVAAMRVPASGFRVTEGVPKRYVSTSEAGNAVTRAFCGDCGSPLYIQVSTRPDIVGLRVGSLDDPSEFRPEAHIFVKSAQPWDHMDPDLPKHQAYPPGRDYGAAE
jgi:hypothetical protein